MKRLFTLALLAACSGQHFEGSEATAGATSGGSSSAGVAGGGSPNHGGGQAGGRAGAPAVAGVAGVVADGGGDDPGAAGAAEGGTEATAGAGGVAACAALPLPPRETWTASASDFGDEAAAVLDQEPEAQTTWSSGAPQSGDEWLQVDLGAVAAVGFVLISSYEAPAVLELDVSGDGAVWVRMPRESSNAWTVELAARYLRILQTGEAPGPWTVWDVEVSCGD